MLLTNIVDYLLNIYIYISITTMIQSNKAARVSFRETKPRLCFFLFYDGDAKIYTKLLTQCSDVIGNVNVTPVTSPNLIFSSVELV